jgi:hypothetical protein
LIMVYSWPGPVPPGARRGTVTMLRCARCRGSLFHTMAKRQPRQEDHEQGCDAFIKAIRIMRYVDELKRSAPESAGTWRRNRRRRKYLRLSAKELSAAALNPDPVAAVSTLGDSYEAECQTPLGKRGKRSAPTELAEALMRACRQLAQGQDPGPITVRPG